MRQNTKVSPYKVIDRLTSQLKDLKHPNKSKSMARILYKNYDGVQLHKLKILGMAQAKVLEQKLDEYLEGEDRRVARIQLVKAYSKEEKQLHDYWYSRAIPLALAASMAVQAKMKAGSDAELFKRLESNFREH